MPATEPLTYISPLWLRSSEPIPVRTGIESTDGGTRLGFLQRVNHRPWQRMLGVLAPEEIYSAAWHGANDNNHVELDQHGGRRILQGTWDIRRNGHWVGTVRRARGWQGFRAVFQVELEGRQLSLTQPILGTETKLVTGADPGQADTVLATIRRTAAGIRKAHTIQVRDPDVDIGILLAVYHVYSVHLRRSLRDWGPRHG